MTENRRRTDWLTWFFRLSLLVLLGVVGFIGKDTISKTEANANEIKRLQQHKADQAVITKIDNRMARMEVMLVAHDKRLAIYLMRGKEE